jgi:hypothetical protein
MLSNLFGSLIGDTFGLERQNIGYDFQRMAAERMGHGLEPIDWAKILSNQYRAISLTRPLSDYEKFLYNCCLDAIHKAND